MVRQGQLIAVVVAFLMGCPVVLMAGASGVQAQTSKKEQARCEGTRKDNVNLPARFTTNDLPGCPQGGLLLGTDKVDELAGEKGDDEIRGLGGSDFVMGGLGNDVIYGGADNDSLHGDGSEEEGNDIIYGGPGDDDVNVFLVEDDATDVIYGGPGNDLLIENEVRGPGCADNCPRFKPSDLPERSGPDLSKNVLHGGPGRDILKGAAGDDVLYGGAGDDNGYVGQLAGLGGEDVLYGGAGDDTLYGSYDGGERDKLYCGKGKDEYEADKHDYVDSSCEKNLSRGGRAD